MCIVKCKKEMLSTLSALKRSFLSALIQNNYIQESKIDKKKKKKKKIAANKFIHGTCRFPLRALMSILYIFVEFSVCFHLGIPTV